MANMSFSAIHANKILAKISKFTVYRPTYEISVCIAYVQKPPLNTHADISSGARGPHLGTCCMCTHRRLR